jgi:circadian clock protein KaiC
MAIAEQKGPWQVERLPTGVPNLDRLIDGGLTRGGLILIVGGPGTGKTVLAEQMAFDWARQGRNVLWLVTLGEPNEKFMIHLTEMGFFDHALVGTRIQLVNLSHFLRRGFEEQLGAIRQTVHAGDYDLVVIDGFQSFRCFMDDVRQVRLFLSELSSELALAGITLLVTLDALPERYWETSEFTLADCIISLGRAAKEAGERRQLQVLKLRGRPVIGGPHTFTIDSAGAYIHPRLESIAPRQPAADTRGWQPFGVPGLDRLLQGGVLEGSSTLVAGSLGTGKSMVASYFLAEAIRRGEPCLSLCLAERLPGLLQRADSFGLPLRQAQESGVLEIKLYDPAQCDPDLCAWEVVRAVEERGIRRLVIDGIDPLEQALQGSGRMMGFMVALTGFMQANRVTSLFTYELPSLLGPAVSFTAPVIGQVTGNLILLRFVEAKGRLRRLLTVVKTRYTQHSATVAELLFDKGELVVTPRPREAERQPDSARYYGEQLEQHEGERLRGQLTPP